MTRLESPSPRTGEFLFASHLAVLAVAVVDAAGTVATTSGSFPQFALHLVYLVPWTVVVAVPLAIFLLGVASALRAASRRAVVGVVSLAVLADYGVIYGVTTTFQNKELASLLAAGLAVVLLGVGIFAYRALAKLESRKPSVSTAIAVGAVFVSLGTLGYLNLDGFAQLDRWTLAAPVVAALVLVLGLLVARPFARPVRRWPWVAVATAVVGTIAAVVVGSVYPEIAGTLAHDGPWSRFLARGVQVATDFDRDRASSFFGGGDCAPFDGEVGPGQAEIPGDGIDNNCIGGDASASAEHRAPGWVEPPADPSKLNFLLITVEALRPDHTTFGGYDRDTTPNLAKLAKRSIVFDRFYASSTFTRLSLPALMTSRTPSAVVFETQPGKKMPRIADENPWLPEVLQQAGFRTGAVHANFSAFDDTNSMGFDRGFDNYDVSAKVRYRGGTMQGFPAKKQTNTTLSFLEDGKGRFFAWVHFLEPHYKYQKYPGSPDFGDDDISKYDSEIWGVDQEIGRIVSALRKKKLLDETVIFVTGDHGEEFMEHGKRFHGTNLYEPQVRTVGLLHVPGVEPKRVNVPVSLADVAPTVANVLGVKKDFDRWSGRNLTPLLVGEPAEDRPVILEVWEITNQRNYRAAVVSWPYKLHWREQGKEIELYDVAEDPAERDDLAAEPRHRGILESLKTTLFTYVDAHDRQPRATSQKAQPPRAELQ